MQSLDSFDREFDLEVKDQKSCENQVNDHLYRHELNKEVTEENNLADAFSDELIMMVSNGALLWYADFPNYVICGIIPTYLKPYQVK